MEIEDLLIAVGVDKKDELNTFIEGIKQTGNPLTALKDKPELFGGILKDNTDFAKVFDAEVGTRVSKGIESGKESWSKANEKDQEKIYQERYAKEHPDETDEQKRIKVLEISAAESNARAETAVLKSNAITALTTAKVESAAELASLLFDNGKEPMEKVEYLSDYVTSLVEATVKATTEKILKENGRVLDEHDREEGKYYTPDQINAMSNREIEENQTKVLESMTYNQTHQ